MVSECPELDPTLKWVSSVILSDRATENSESWFKEGGRVRNLPTDSSYRNAGGGLLVLSLRD